LVFDGRSLLADSTGRIAAKAGAFEEDLLIADVIAEDSKIQIKSLYPEPPQPTDIIDEVYQHLC